MSPITPALPWLAPGEAFPPASQAWGEHTPAPGLLAAGGELSTASLQQAYRQGIFPWFSTDQPILWWSPDPRMVLNVQQFRLHRSLHKVIQTFERHDNCEVRMDTAFEAVIRACANQPRPGQQGTWIVPDMVQAYVELHRAGLAHSVETWMDGRLVAGLYCVAVGRAVFGESMFTTVTDGSKIALAALVSFCRVHGIGQIDCQQNTKHLASLGAREIARSEFLREVQAHAEHPPVTWRFERLYWRQLISPAPQRT